MKETSDSSQSQPVQLPPDDVASRERIEKRAYHLWLGSGGSHGEHLRHWLQAESEVLKAIHHEKEEQSAVRTTKSPGKQRSSSTSNGEISNE